MTNFFFHSPSWTYVGGAADFFGAPSLASFQDSAAALFGASTTPPSVSAVDATATKLQEANQGLEAELRSLRELHDASTGEIARLKTALENAGNARSFREELARSEKLREENARLEEALENAGDTECLIEALARCEKLKQKSTRLDEELSVLHDLHGEATEEFAGMKLEEEQAEIVRAELARLQQSMKLCEESYRKTIGQQIKMVIQNASRNMF